MIKVTCRRKGGNNSQDPFLKRPGVHVAPCSVTTTEGRI
jgi:hypothetical protein